MTRIDYTTDIFTASPRVSKAFVLADAGHTGQLRAGSALPYITHPMSVALAVARYGDEALVCAALLHDAPEDTDVTFKQIARTLGDDDFADDVVTLVRAVTKDPDLTKMENVQRTVSLGLRPTLLKEADTSHNISDLDPGSSLFEFYGKSLVVIRTAKAIYLSQAAG